MNLEQTVPYTTREGNNYLIKFEIFPCSSLPLSIEIPVIILTLVQVDKLEQNGHGFFKYLAQYVCEYLNEFDVILYYYCDHADIEMRKTRCFSPQQYRNEIFWKVYESIPNNPLYRLQIYIADNKYGDHYISLISQMKNQETLDKLKEEIVIMNAK